MTKEEFFKKFNRRELEVICTKNDFLNVLVAEPFNRALAEEVANRLLDSNSPLRSSFSPAFGLAWGMEYSTSPKGNHPASWVYRSWGM